MSTKTSSQAKKEDARPALVPKLRFPEFRGAEAWEQAPLGSLMEITSSKRVHESDWTADGVPFYRAREIVALNNMEAISPLYISEDLYRENAKRSGEIAAGDLLVTGVGSIGVPYLVKPNDRFYFKDGNIIWLKNRGTKLLGTFLHLLYGTRFVQSQIKTMAGVGTVGTYTIDNANRTIVAFPPTPAEQQKIAECLSSLDELMAAQARKVDALKTHKIGLMQQLFPREGETHPRLRFPEFQNAGEWKARELGPKTNKVGSGITPTGGDKNYKPSGRPFVRSQNVGWGVLLLDDVAFIDEETHASFDSTEIKVRDVLLNITGASIGRSAVADDRIAGGNVNQHVCIIRTKPDELDPLFLNQFLISQRGQKQIDSFQAGGNRQGLNFAQIRSFAVPLPSSPAEQQRIASCLSSLDALITAETQKLEILKTHKKGLMQQLFPSPEEG